MKKRIFTYAYIIILILLCFIYLRMFPTYFMNTNNHFIYNMSSIIQDYAIKHNKLFFPTKYKEEMEQYLENKIPNKIKKLDEIMANFENYQKDFRQKTFTNTSIEEYYDKIDEFETELDTEDFYLYVELSKINDKYLLIPIGNIPTDNSKSYNEVIMLYFKKYKVDDSKLAVFNMHLYEQYKKLEDCKKKVKYK